MSKVISIDTDGIYVDGEVNIKEINDHLDKRTEELFHLKNQLHMDLDDFDAGFFRATKGKHYVLKDGDKIILHGQSFKGSHQPVFFDKVLIQVCKDMFAGVTGRVIDVKSFPFEDLIQSIKVKDEESYASDSSMSMQLINAAKKEMPSVKLKDSDQLSYVRTTKGLELIMPGKIYGEIDYKYYQGIMDKIHDRLMINERSVDGKIRKQLTFVEL